MSLYNEWKRLASKERSQNEYNKFWGDFFEKEKKNYEYILEHKDEVIGGKITDISQTFDMDKIALMGFVDGINTSLKSEIDLDNLTEESEIKLDIDFEKLYYNMLDANADWLCNLPQWEGVLSLESRNEITKEYKKANTAVRNKAGRNDPCPCGSGKKYKKCCGANA